MNWWGKTYLRGYTLTMSAGTDSNILDLVPHSSYENFAPDWAHGGDTPYLKVQGLSRGSKVRMHASASANVCASNVLAGTWPRLLCLL